MKLLKSYQNTKQVFDTEDVYNVKLLPAGYNCTDFNTPLHHSHNSSDKLWLLKYFAPEHPVFHGFTDSFYYVQ